MLGKIVVFEGIDGSGKGTQSKKLYSYLKSKDIKVKIFEFPSYGDTFFGKEIGEYLNGKFGKIDEIDPKLSAMLYAGDRYEKRDEIITKLRQNYTIICDRYVSSNIAHQIAKYRDFSQRAELKRWIEKLEYEVYGLPRADIIFFMDIDPDISNGLILKKGKRDYTDKKMDLHESNTIYLRRVYEIFKELSKEKNWINIRCQKGDSVESIEDIHKQIKDFLDDQITKRNE
jgi:dTMP kinase